MATTLPPQSAPSLMLATASAPSPGRVLSLSPKPVVPIVVRDAGGIPMPPTDIVAALQRWEPALGLRYHACQWQLTWTWKEHDPRRQWIKEGKWKEADAFDIIGPIPLDCALEEVPAYAIQSLKQYPRAEVSKLIDSVSRYNAVNVSRQQVDHVVTETMDNLHRDPALRHTRAENRVSVLTNLTASPVSSGKTRRRPKAG